MPKRTTIEIDEHLLTRAKRALGLSTTRATVEEALRRVSDDVEAEQEQRAVKQRAYLRRVTDLTDAEVLASEEMWR